MKNILHKEFIDNIHFEQYYERHYVTGSLSNYIDYIWTTRFDSLWQQHPHGFTDKLYPNIGYTYLINLGTPYTMFIQNQPFLMKADGFLPRFHTIACKHSVGNQLLGIKFKVSPILLDKKIDFSEYKHAMFSLSYLLPANVIQAIKMATNFTTTVHTIESYFNNLIHQADNNIVTTVTQAIQCFESNVYKTIPIQTIANNLAITTKTLQRYFLIAVGIPPKQVYNTIRIRKALQNYLTVNDGFIPSAFGYYDYSHFYKHASTFLQEDASYIFSKRKAK